jgi:hypothetical protein
MARARLIDRGDFLFNASPVANAAAAFHDLNRCRTRLPVIRHGMDPGSLMGYCIDKSGR